MNPSEKAVDPSFEAISPSSEEISPSPAAPQEMPEKWFRHFKHNKMVAMVCEFVIVFDNPNAFDK